MVMIGGYLVMVAGALLLAAYFTLRRRLVLGAVCLSCALATMGQARAGEACKPYKYADGDTFTFLGSTGSVTVRVAGFDAPERGQPYWRNARSRMEELTRGGAVCECYKADRYGRQVCNVRLIDGSNVATHLLAAGLGCIDPRFEGEAPPGDREAAREALQSAQAARRGMWAEPGALCAYDYRRLKRAK